MRKLMFASLAINLFLLGALVGTFVTGMPVFHTLMPHPPEFHDINEQPGILLLRDVRSRLSEQGRVIFDEEINQVIARIRQRHNPRVMDAELQAVLSDPEVSDAEIRDAYANLKNAISNEMSLILDSMATVAVRLSKEDREKMTLGPPEGSLSKVE